MCTGFVKSPFEIDRNKIKISLLTENNLLKETTNIVPYNGFFAIPIYNTGKYILKVDSVTKVFFDPPLFKIDLQNLDNNAKNREYIFNAIGYEIKGKVEGIINIDRVAIKLESFDGEIVKMETVNNFGEFYFVVVPGEYSISILTSQAACFHKSQYTVNVIDSPISIPITYVSGYSVIIHINGLNKLDSKIKFQILSDVELDVENCITVTENENNKMYRCTTEVITQLPYIIKCFPRGRYIIKPIMTEDTGISFLPNKKELKIENENLNIFFEVDTFRAYGKTEANGVPIGDVKIYSGNQQIATSNNEGVFVWDNLKKGIYNMEAKKDGIIFSPISVTLNVNQPIIQPFNVIKFRVSGQVTLDNNKTEKVDLSIESLIINARLSIRTNEQGKFLIFLPVGNYSVTVNDKKHGFVPGTHLVIFKDKPQDNVIFSKLKIDIIVIIKIFENYCKDITVNIKDEEGNVNEGKLCTNNQIIFNNLSPGTFVISIDERKLYCWKENDIRKDVTGNGDNIVIFFQTGYYLKFNSPIESNFNVIGSESNVLYPVSVKRGINMLCVDKKREYKILNNDCYILNDASSKLSVTKKPINYIVIKEMMIRVGVEMIGILVQDPLQFEVKMITNKSSEKKDYITEVDSNKEHTLKIYIDSKYEKELFLVTPIFKEFIVEPQYIKVKFDKNCLEKKNIFKIYKGHFINGKISPYVSGVVGKYVDEENNVKLYSYINEDGTFKIGPIKNISDKYLFLEKERFKFILISKSNVYLYKTIELSTLRVEFINNITGEFIRNVMATIYSESSYLTKNFIPNGTLEITNLEGGNYIISPFRQEYRFHNTSKIITIETGKLTLLTLYGTQISYSTFGKITFPNNDPVPNKELYGISKNCDLLEEEGLSDKNGEYRIPNLYPHCTYKITLKNIKKNINFYTFPKEHSITIQDSPVYNVNFIYFKLSNQQLEIFVKIDLIDIPKQNIIYVGIYREKEKIAVLKKILNKEQLSFFVPKLSLDNKTYNIKIDKISDNRIKYQYNTGVFRTNTTFQYVRIILEPRKVASETGVPPENIIILMIMGLFVIAFFNTDNIKLFIIFLIDFWKYTTRRDEIFIEERVYVRRR